MIEPIIVVKNGERYNILSGRHRFRACQKVGKTEIPCYIKEADETTARYILIATNTDRNNEYSPIVYACAYAEQLELMKKLGKKAVVNAIAEQNGINRKQIYRYLRLNYLIPELQKWVEDKVLTIEAAVELSFLSAEKQLTLYKHLQNLGVADNVISRTLKVEKTKGIRQASEKISDDDFSANIDKIIFGRYGQESKAEAIEDVTEPAPEIQPSLKIEPEPEQEIEPTEKEIEVQAEEPTSIINTPLPPKEEMGLEAPKTKREETAETAGTIPTEKATKSNRDRFDEIVKGYMLLALQAHGVEMDNISMTQLDAVFDRYTKDEAAKVYRREG